MIPRNQLSATSITTASDDLADPALIVERRMMTEAQTELDALAALVTLLERSRPAWHNDGACRESDIDFTSRAPGIRSKAVQVCGTCAAGVRAQCLDWALEIDDKVAVLGGMDPPARARLARTRQKQQPDEKETTDAP